MLPRRVGGSEVPCSSDLTPRVRCGLRPDGERWGCAWREAPERGGPCREAGGQARRSRALDPLEVNTAVQRPDIPMCRPCLTRFLLATGQRIGECLAVTWLDVDLVAGTVAVDHTVIRVKGRGLVRKGTKSKAGERTLLLLSWALDDLRARHSAGVHLEDAVFTDSRGGLRDPSNTRRMLRKALDRAGFEWVTSHNFRKTTATLLDDAGLPARLIADQLGHARPSMTQDVYMSRRAVDRRAVEALEDALR